MVSQYSFNTSRLITPTLSEPTSGSSQNQSSPELVVLVACGSFSPITYLHLRMFEQARDHAKLQNIKIVGGFLSPVGQAYKKKGLAEAHHRVEMCRLATEDDSTWIAVDSWEAEQDEYTRTALVLDHFDRELNKVRGGVDCVIEDPETGESRIEKRPVRVMLLAGSDLIQTMAIPGVWDEKDLHHILAKYGAFIIERAESELDHSIFSSSSVHSRSPLALYRDRIIFVETLLRQDVSSTKIRMFLRKGLSSKYLTPTVVLNYIEDHKLYQEEDRLRPNDLGEKLAKS